MTLNFPAPYQLDFAYTTTPPNFQTMTHHMTIGIQLAGAKPDVGTPFGDLAILARNGTQPSLQSSVDAFLTGLLPLYPDTADFFEVTLFAYTGESLESEWLSVYQPTGLLFTGGTSTPAHQATITMRSSEGGHGRLQLMESSLTGNVKEAFPSSTSAVNTLKDLLCDEAQGFIAQDGGYFLVGMRLSQGQNERLFRKRFRE